MADSPKWTVGLLALLCVGHALLASVYAWVIPYRQAGFTQGQFLPDIGAPDERAHLNLVGRLIAGRGYVRLDKDSPTFNEDYQAHQPPAFYAVAASVARLTGQTDIDRRETGLVLRGLNTAFGVVNLLGIYFLVRWIGRSARHALTAAGVAALVPMNLALSGSVSNDVLLFCGVTWSLAFALKAAQSGWKWRDALLSALCAGIALWTKSSAVLLLPVLATIGFWSKDIRRHWMASLMLFGLPVVLVLPWWGRNMEWYGEPLLSRTFVENFPHSYKVSQLRNPVSSYRWLYNLIERTVESATGVFGYTDIHYPSPAFSVGPGIAVWLASCFGAFSAWLGGFRKQLVVSALFFALVFGMYASFNLTYMQPQARYVFPALPFVAWWVAEGLCLVRDRWTGLWLGVYIALNLFTVQMLSHDFQVRVEALQEVLGDRAR